ncbi:LAMI_0D00782g1_1 [Lachancea mirantina]|uniref:LAMI_0D00782g1_1 n=1 Tax=Lachancea mirantina TaxID=1230905 RepID=A0A1G4J8D6_9SACH|nr:LAMI_0D00782g1_1 [Lachancea mirantina]
MKLVCTKSLVARSFTSDVSSTAKSFEHWDTCMANKTCKIIAIVGIVLASIVAFWIVGSLLRCIRQGSEGFADFCCWCCGSSRRRARVDQTMPAPGTGYMPGPTVAYQPVRAPQMAYYRGDDFYDEHSPSQVEEVEQDFDLDARKNKHMRDRRESVPLVYDDAPEEHELTTYHPQMNTFAPSYSTHPSFAPMSQPRPARYSPTRHQPGPYPADDESNVYNPYRHGNY